MLCDAATLRYGLIHVHEETFDRAADLSLGNGITKKIARLHKGLAMLGDRQRTLGAYPLKYA